MSSGGHPRWEGHGGADQGHRRVQGAQEGHSRYSTKDLKVGYHTQDSCVGELYLETKILYNFQYR